MEASSSLEQDPFVYSSRQVLLDKSVSVTRVSLLDGYPGIQPSSAAFGCRSSQPGALEVGLGEQLQSLHTSHAESQPQPGKCI